MKNNFVGFYKPTESDFDEMWNSSIFVLDTNVLLHYYRYPENSRELLFKILNLLKERLWIPHQVAMEYHFNMDEEVIRQKHAYEDLKRSIKSKLDEVTANTNNFSRHSNLNVDTIIKKIEEFSKSVDDELDKQKQTHPDLNSVKERLAELFDGKVGSHYSASELEEKYKMGEDRYRQLIPPGFKDLKEKKGKIRCHDGQIYKDEFGDLIFWFQIIDKAKLENKSVILITDDTKEDWWKKIKGETIGPHPELIQEFNKKTSGMKFYMYQTEQFIKYAQTYFNLEDNIENAIEEIKEIKKSYEDFSHNILKTPQRYLIDKTYENTVLSSYKEWNKFLSNDTVFCEYTVSIMNSKIISNMNDVVADFKSKLKKAFPNKSTRILKAKKDGFLFITIDISINYEVSQDELKDILSCTKGKYLPNNAYTIIGVTPKVVMR